MATMTMTKRRSRTQTTPENNPRHPLAMPATVSIEMWERFSFYGMQAILAYYLYYATTDGGLGLERAQATTLLGAYGASVYLCTLAGGWIGDRLIGTERTLLTGCIALMVGHLSLSTLSGGAGATFGLALIAIGSGFVKTAAITILGHAYPTDDPRRDAGFQLFYMSINVGAFASPLLTGWLREHYGYHAGFSSAAVGMGVALIAFIYGRHKLSAFAFTVPSPIRPQERRRLLLGSLGVLVAVGAVVATLKAITGNLVTTVATAGLLVPVGAAVAYFVVMFRSPKVTAPERTHLRAYIPLWIGAVLFFMITEQAAGKMATFADSNTDLRLPLFGWSITAEAYQSVNPAAIVILAPLIGMLFTRRAGRFPSTIMKFVIAVLIVGLSALMLGYGFQIWPGGEHLSPWWFLALVYVIQTVAELFLTPVGLATTTALAPKSFASQAMGLWWLSVATGQGVAGFVIAQTEDASDATYYYGLGVATLLMALVLFAVAPWTQRQMADVEVTVQD